MHRNMPIRALALAVILTLQLAGIAVAAAPGGITASGNEGLSQRSGPVGQVGRTVTGDVYVTGAVYAASDVTVTGVTASEAVETVAGNGAMGYSGDGGPATGAGLYMPRGVAVDSAGNLYIADQINSRVRKVIPTGTITTVAGDATMGYSGDGGPAVSAEMGQPAGVAVDSTGDLYIADPGNNRIRKVAPDGTISTVAGNGTAGHSGDGGPAVSAELNNPAGLAVDRAGDLYIADMFNNCIRKVAPDGTISTVAGNGTLGYSGGGGPPSSAEFFWPEAVAVDSAGNLYIADTYNSRVREVLPAGTVGTPFSQTFSASGGTAPYTFSESGNVPGLTFSGSTLSGTPTQAGSFPVTVTATDVDGNGGSANYTLAVNPAAPSYSLTVNVPALAITTTSLSAGTVGQSYNETIKGNDDGTAPYTFCVTSGSLPGGLALDAPTGVISGTPTTAGMYTFTVTVKDANNNTASESYTVTVGTASVIPSPHSVTLSDIAGNWAQAEIEKLVSMGAISGYPDGTFRPNNDITRAEFVTVLVKALKLTPKAGRVFADTQGTWAQSYISTAVAYDIVSGYDLSHFGPNDPITREQITAMVLRAAKLVPVTGNLTFTDAGQIDAWASEDVITAVKDGIIHGYPDNTYRPLAYATRAEAVTVFAGLLK